MVRTACTEPQCLYKGALYLTSVPVQGCTLPYLGACTRVHFTLPRCLYKGALYLTSVPAQGCTLPYLSACTRVHFTVPLSHTPRHRIWTVSLHRLCWYQFPVTLCSPWSCLCAGHELIELINLAPPTPTLGNRRRWAIIFPTRSLYSGGKYLPEPIAKRVLWTQKLLWTFEKGPKKELLLLLGIESQFEFQPGVVSEPALLSTHQPRPYHVPETWSLWIEFCENHTDHTWL